MRVYTFISKNGDSLPLAQRIQNEGHRVIFYINDKDRRNVGEGLVEKSPLHEELISDSSNVLPVLLDMLLYPKPDCIIMDMGDKGYGRLAENLRERGYPLIGGSEWGNRIELNRLYGDKVMLAMGVAPYRGGDGIEVSTELWFNGENVLGVNHSMKERRLMEGDIGPVTDGMGSVVWLGNTESKLYKEGIDKVIPALKKVKYKGPISLDTIVSEDKLYGLGFTARFNYNTLFILLEMFKGRVNDLLYGMASGVIKYMDFKAEWGVGIGVSVPPYPLNVEPKLYKDVLIQGINSQNLKHIWFYDVYKKNGKYLCSGNGGSIATVTARGDKIDDWSPIRDARRRVLRTISNLTITDMMFRRDIGDRVDREHSQLQKWGWL